MDSAKSYPRTFVALVLLIVVSYLAGAAWVFFGFFAWFSNELEDQAPFLNSMLFAGTICALIAFALGVHRQFWTVAIFAMFTSIAGCAGSFTILLG